MFEVQRSEERRVGKECRSLKACFCNQPLHCSSQTIARAVSMRRSENIPLCLQSKITFMVTKVHEVVSVLILAAATVSEIMYFFMVGNLFFTKSNAGSRNACMDTEL